MSRAGRTESDGLVWALFAVAAALLFIGLGRGVLWQDEAETALLARHTLQSGYPNACGNQGCIEPGPSSYGPGNAWTYAPWLPFYLLAGAFAVLGESAAVARGLFAAFGWLCLLLTWQLAGRLGAPRRVKLLSVAILACSVPFLLHMRQCRYYSLTTALLLWVCLAYLDWRRAPRGAPWPLAMALALLFHTNFGTFVPTVAALAADQWSLPRADRWKLAWAAAAVVVCAVPWLWIGLQPGLAGALTWGRITHHAQYYVRVTNKYLAPLAVMAVTACWWRAAPWHAPGLPRPEARGVKFLMLLVVAQFVFLIAVPDQRHLRYLIPVQPVLTLGVAWWLAAAHRRAPALGWAAVVLVVFTTLPFTGRPRVPLLDFAQELRGGYAGPMDGVVAYLRAHAHPGETVKIPYDDRTVMFHTALRVESPRRFADATSPDWIILRRDWLPDGFLESPYFACVQATYERIELNAPDITWQQREDPGTHHFGPVTGAPRLVLYRRRS